MVVCVARTLVLLWYGGVVRSGGGGRLVVAAAVVVRSGAFQGLVPTALCHLMALLC